MFDIICIGRVFQNIFIRSSQSEVISLRGAETIQRIIGFPYGEKVGLEKAEFNFGGGGYNTAVGFKRLGVSSALAARIGTDLSAHAVTERLSKEGVSTELLTSDPENRTGFSISLNDEKGERTALIFGGANDFFTKSDLMEKKLKETSFLCISHLSSSFNDELHDLFHTSSKNLKIIFNPGISQINLGLRFLEKLLDHTWLLCLNAREAAILTKTSFTREVEEEYSNTANPLVEEMLEKLAKTGPRYLVITRTKNGSQAFYKGKHFYQEVKKVKAIDSTGAGDAFTVGLSAGIIMDKKLDVALKMGTLNAASVISKIGAQHGLMRKTQMEKALKKWK